MMIIKECKQLEYDLAWNDFFTVKPEMQTSISLIYTFFRENFYYLKLEGQSHFKQNIEKLLEHGMGFENVCVSVDPVDNLVYLSEYYYGSDRATTHQIEALLEEENFIELCKIGFLDHVVLTKDNLYDLILTWDTALQEQSPFLLLYLDDKNWYNVVPFETQQATEKFVADHSQPESL